jgi:Ca-activated chloride channel family protein
VSFGAPQYLLALVALPLATMVYVFFERRRARRSADWSRPPLQPNMVSRPSRWVGLIPPVLFLAGLTFLLIGFARPQQARSSNARVTGPTVVLALDLSGSMAAGDLAPTRFRAARELAIKVVRRLPAKYEVAVVTFGNRVHLVVAPTFDHASVIANLPKTITPLAASSIGDGISSSVSLVIEGLPQGAPVDRLHPPGAVVVLSDGAQTGAGTTPADAASTAFVYAIPINSVVLGTSHGSVTQPFKVDTFHTTIQIAVPALPLSLQYASQTTGGAFFEASSPAGLNTAAEKLPAALTKEGLSPVAQSVPGNHELSAAAGEIGLVFVLGSIFLSGLLFGRLA